LINQQIKQQVKVVAMALQERFEYGSSLESIRNFFSDKITIDGFDLSVAKKYKVMAFVPELKNIDEVEIIIDNINHGMVEGFKSATMEGLAIDKGKGWSFTMEVILL
jgi:nitrous oxide reductase